MTYVIGVSMMKNERDVAEGVIRHMAGQVDALIVADNGSTDGTGWILRGLRGRLPVPLEVVDDPEPAYYQSIKMTALAARAAGQHYPERDIGIVPFDADELWYVAERGSGPHPWWRRIRDVFNDPAYRRVDVFEAPMYNHVPTGEDPPGIDPFVTMGWRGAEPGTLGKVAFRWEPKAVIEQGNHGVRMSGSLAPRIASGALEIRHFPYRSEGQFVSKARNGAAALALTDLPRDSGLHWRQFGELDRDGGREALARAFRGTFYQEDPGGAPWAMVHDPAPYRPVALVGGAS